MLRIAKRLIGIGLVGIITVAGCTVVVIPPGQVQKSFSSSSAFDDVGTLRVRWAGGDITVRFDASATEITATGKIKVTAATQEEASDALADIEIVFETADTTPPRKTLRFETPDVPFTTVITADVTIVVPGGVALDIENTAGAIDVSGNTAATEVTQTSGDVRVANQRGATVVDLSRGAVDVASESGDVTVAVNDGGIAVTARPSATGSVVARTGVGSVALEVPADTPASIDLHGSLGSVSADLDAFDVTNLTVSGARIRATLNGGGADIIGESSVGSVNFGPLGDGS